MPRALRYLAEHGADAQSWTIILPRRRTYEEIVVWWSPRSPGGKRGSASLNAETGLPDAAKVRDTGGGGHFFEMHYSLHYIPYETAIRIVGLCAMARHHRDLFARAPVRSLEAVLRWGGWMAIAVSLGLSIAAAGTAIGIVQWTAFLMMAAFLVALLLTYKDIWWRA